MSAHDLPIRASILRGLPAVVSRAGGDGAAFLAQHGFTLDQLQDGNVYVSHRRFEHALDDAAVRFRVNDLGLQLASQQELSILGELALAMRNSRTLDDAMDATTRYLHVYSPTISLTRTADPLGDASVTGFRYDITAGVESGGAQAIDYGIGLVHRFLRALNGERAYGLRSVLLPHPALVDVARYERFFGAPVVFATADAVLRVPVSALSHAIEGGNAMVRDLALEHLRARFGERRPHLTVLATAVLEDELGLRIADLASVAEALQMHPRALQRSLAEEGTTVAELLDEVRRARAWRLIVGTQLPFSDVAARLGLREQSSLTRASRRWFLATPSVLRRSARDDTAAIPDDRGPGQTRRYRHGARSS